ncbi:MAG: Rab family GTPase [Candidatus Thorarchaeota archaeon]
MIEMDYSVSNSPSQDFHVVRKVVMIGAGGSGKTALVNRFLTNRFTEQYIVTIGSQFAVKIVPVNDSSGNEKRVKLLIWDLAGQKRFDFIRNSYYRGAKGALLVFDTTRKSTFNVLDNWIAETEKALDESIPIIVLANKVDLDDQRTISSEVAREYVIKKDLAGYLETSALTGQNVEEAFEMLAKNVVL